MNPYCSNITICRACANQFSDQRPQSMGNPNLCVPCATGHELPDKIEDVKLGKARWDKRDKDQ